MWMRRDPVTVQLPILGYFLSCYTSLSDTDSVERNIILRHIPDVTIRLNDQR
jgi:hypothetical protein